MGGTWYLQNDGSDVIGPVTTELVVEGILKGRVPVTSNVCPVGGSAWIPLAAQAEFASAIRQVAPPPALTSPMTPHVPRQGRWLIVGAASTALVVLLVAVLLVTIASRGSTAPAAASAATACIPTAGCIPRATALICAGRACGQKDDGCCATVYCGPCSDAACVPHEASLICAGTTCDRAGYCVPYCGQHDDGCGGTVDCGPCSADPRAALRTPRALDICNQLQAGGVVYDCRTDREQALRLNKGLVDAAAFLFAEEDNGQVGTPGFVFQFGDADAYEAMRKKLHCNEGAPCLGSPAALLIVKTVYAEAVIPDRDWSKIQGVLNQAASHASPGSSSPTIVTIPVPIHPGEQTR